MADVIAKDAHVRTFLYPHRAANLVEDDPVFGAGDEPLLRPARKADEGDENR